MLKPKLYAKIITDITVDFLNSNKIKGLLVDIDNTVLSPENELLPNIMEWFDNMKLNNIKICFVSNTHSVDKKKMIQDVFGVEVIKSAWKPLRGGFLKGLKILELNRNDVAMIGDQLFTDILGGNLLGLFTIYVEPILPYGEGFIVYIKRPLERFILRKYKSKYMS